MRCLNRLVEPTAGKILHLGEEITGKGSSLRALRRQFGMVFQQFNLVKRLSVLTNVLTGRLAYRSIWRSLFYNFSKEDKRIAIECLARVNMDHKAFQRADTLMVLEGGRMREYGSRAQLAADRDSHFAHLLRTAHEENLEKHDPNAAVRSGIMKGGLL